MNTRRISKVCFSYGAFMLKYWLNNCIRKKGLDEIEQKRLERTGKREKNVAFIKVLQRGG